MEPSDDIWLRIGYEQVLVYEKNPTVYTCMLVKNRPLRELMYCVYRAAMKWKLEPPLEKLPEADRRKIWQAATAEAAGTINQEECIKLAKALYTIYCFLNQ